MTTHPGLIRLKRLQERSENLGDFPKLVTDLTKIRNGIGRSLKMEFNKKGVKCIANLDEFPEQEHLTLNITFIMARDFKAGNEAIVRAYLDTIFNGLEVRGKKVMTHCNFTKK